MKTFVLLGIATSQLCPSTPSDTQCSDFVLPAANISALSSNLCEQMPGMVGCSLDKKCKESGKSTEECDAFSIYADHCTDMPSMSPCSTYSKMCGPNPSSALASQCKNSPPLQNLPSTEVSTKAIFSICNEMSMPGCDICKIQNADSIYSECDLLGTYSSLCASMPEMSQCSSWKAMCATTPSLSYCATAMDSDSSAPPMMRMYFHTGFADYVLFEKWVPRTAFQYTLTWVACFLLAIFYEGLQAWATFMEYKWADQAKIDKVILGSAFGAQRPDDISNSSSKTITLLGDIAGLSRGFEGFKVAAATAVLRTISVTISYSLMLIAMTFNVGLFFAVVFGFGFGVLLFGPVVKAITGSSARSGSECH